MAIKKDISDQEIDEMIKQTNATMAMEGFEPADFAYVAFKKYAKGIITKDEAMDEIKKHVMNFEK